MNPEPLDVPGLATTPEAGMAEIHCHYCGGVIGDVATVEYRPPRASAQLAMPHAGACQCTPPIVYEDPPVMGSPENDQRDQRED